MSTYRILLLDLDTLETAWYEYQQEEQYDEGRHSSWWAWGNGGCDCNRLLFISEALGRSGSELDFDPPCGDTRVKIVQALRNGVELPEWREI